MRGAHLSQRQVRPVGHIQPRRSSLDAAEYQVPHGIEADRVQRERLIDGGRDLCEWEGLQQPQHLDVLAGSVLAQSRLQQPAQMSKALGQLQWTSGAAWSRARLLCSSKAR